MEFIKKMLDSIYRRIDFGSVPIFDYFENNFQKRVLISYVTKPFLEEDDFRHSNNAEAIEIAKQFDDRGYAVDIIEYSVKYDKNYFENKKYDVVFGLEPVFLAAVNHLKPKKSIYYATGAHFEFQNSAEQERLVNLKKRKGLMLKPRRYVFPHESSSLADAIISIGNDWTKGTYAGKAKEVKCIPVSAYSFFSLAEVNMEKDWISARKNFLWFNSVGAVHKGLDLLLEIFSKNKDLHLYISGKVAFELDFIFLYKKELFFTENIHFMGWTSPRSKRFKKLATKCAFIVSPSCSEGMSGSLATCMHLGMIPLSSEESGLDIGDCGVMFEDNNIETIEKVIIESSNKSKSWLDEKAEKSCENAKANNTLNNFSIKFGEALDEIL
jgi:glycosyltransferase involved in cell wall biosynthesis